MSSFIRKPRRNQGGMYESGISAFGTDGIRKKKLFGEMSRVYCAVKKVLTFGSVNESH